jgi:hypothetical protein
MARRVGYHAWRAISVGNHQLASPVLFQLTIQKLLLVGITKISSLVFVCVSLIHSW